MLQGASACTPCSVGKFGIGDGNNCQSCSSGQFQGDTGKSDCDLCAAGRFQPLKGQSECEDCPVGKFSNSSGAESSCEECPAGRFTDETGRDECTPCAAGSFAESKGTVSCTLCGSGKYTSVNESQTCTPCRVGSFQSESGRTTCDLCGIGKAINVEGQGSCFSCAAGRYADSQGQTECTLCSAGTFQDEDGATTCSQCNLGESTASLGQSECAKCAKGQYMASTGATECDECSSGTFTSSLGQTICEECSVGKYQNGIAQLSCLECDAGRYSNETGKSECTACEEGKYQDVKGQSSCNLCPLGTSNSITAKSECDVCAQGHYAPDEGKVECDPCPAGTHQPSTGSSTCVQCVEPFFSTEEAQAQCRSCNSNEYRPGLFGDNTTEIIGGSNERCIACPDEGATCASGRIYSSDGFFIEFNENGEASPFECPIGYCDGDDCAEGRIPMYEGSSVESAAVNFLCGECKEGYVPSGSDCIECSNWQYFPLFLSFIAILATVVFMYKVAQMQLDEQTEQTSYIQTTLYFIQMGLLFLGPPDVWTAWLRAFNLDIATFMKTFGSTSCIGPFDDFMNMFFQLVFPGGMIVMHFFFFLFHLIFAKLHQKYDFFTPKAGPLYLPKNKDYSWERAVDVHLRTFLSILIFVYVPFTEVALKYLSCTSVGSGSQTKRVVLSNPGIECYTSDYFRYFSIIIPVLFCSFIFIGYVFVFLKKNRSNPTIDGVMSFPKPLLIISMALTKAFCSCRCCCRCCRKLDLNEWHDDDYVRPSEEEIREQELNRMTTNPEIIEAWQNEIDEEEEDIISRQKSVTMTASENVAVVSTTITPGQYYEEDDDISDVEDPSDFAFQRQQTQLERVDLERERKNMIFKRRYGLLWEQFHRDAFYWLLINLVCFICFVYVAYKFVHLFCLCV